MRFILFFTALNLPLFALVPTDCSELPPRSFVLEQSYNKCITCHKNREMGPNTLKDIDQAVCRRSTTLVNGMIKYAFNEPLLDFNFDDADLIRARQQQLQQEKVRAFASRAAAVQFFSASKQTKLALLIPSGDLTDSGGVYLENLKSRGMVFYDESVLPKVVQLQGFDSNEMGIQFPASGVSRRDTKSGKIYPDRGGLEFPWLHAAGTDMADIENYKFFVPPAAGPMVEAFRVSRRKHPYMYSNFVNETALLHGYTFLPGTVFGEVLLTSKPGSGAKYVFEIRLREVDSDGRWFFDVLRPFPNQESLIAKVKTLYPYWESEDELKSFVSTLEKPSSSFLKVLDYATFFDPFLMKQNSTALTVFPRFAAVQELGPLHEDLVEVLFQKTAFRSAIGAFWTETKDRDGKNILGFSATAKQEFSIFPKNYLGTHLKLNSSTCVQCHSNTQYYVKHFDPKKGVIGTTDGSNREWYNHMHGSTPQPSNYGLANAGVFSFHPFATDGMTQKIGGAVYSVLYNSKLTTAGLIRNTGEIR